MRCVLSEITCALMSHFVHGVNYRFAIGGMCCVAVYDMTMRAQCAAMLRIHHATRRTQEVCAQ